MSSICSPLTMSRLRLFFELNSSWKIRKIEIPLVTAKFPTIPLYAVAFGDSLTRCPDCTNQTSLKSSCSLPSPKVTRIRFKSTLPTTNQNENLQIHLPFSPYPRRVYLYAPLHHHILSTFPFFTCIHRCCFRVHHHTSRTQTTCFFLGPRSSS